MLFFKVFLSFFINSKNFAIFKCRAKGRLVNKLLLARNEHVIDIFTSEDMEIEDMENILLCIFRYLTTYYVINCFIWPLHVTHFFRTIAWLCVNINLEYMKQKHSSTLDLSRMNKTYSPIIHIIHNLINRLILITFD